MGQAERVHTRPEIAAQASVHYGHRGVPADWFLDPADPLATERYRDRTPTTLEDQATAYLAERDTPAAVPGGQSSLLFLPVADPRTAEQQDPRADFVPLGQPAWSAEPLVQGDLDDDGELSWQGDALCAQTDPEAFFPEKGGSTRDAKKVCGACMVRSECLEYALENDERFGIWGGMSERERRRLRKQAV